MEGGYTPTVTNSWENVVVATSRWEKYKHSSPGDRIMRWTTEWSAYRSDRKGQRIAYSDDFSLAVCSQIALRNCVWHISTTTVAVVVVVLALSVR